MPATISRSLLLAAVLIALPALQACGDAKAEPEGEAATAIPPVPVMLAGVEHSGVARPVSATGTFGPKDEVTLSFKIGGIVSRVNVDEGATVRQGQQLATLDLREIDAMRTKARIAVDKATRDATRLRALHADSVASLSQLQDAESALAAAQADLETANVNREYAVITAPEAGRILRRRVQAGALVSPGAEVLTLGSDARGRVVRVGLPDRDAVHVSIGLTAQVTFDAMPDRTFTGRVSQKGAATDPRTGMVPVEVNVTGAGSMPAGTVARVSIAVPARTEVTLVPVDAIIEADADSATVYSMRDGKAVRHLVRVLFIDGARVAVTGLDGVERVITSGAPYVTDGAAVREVDGAR
jgi:membrane fusion protein, multidrug efflux system